MSIATEARVRARLTMKLGKPVLMLLKDDTIIAGKVDAVSATHAHVGWVQVPIHRIESVSAKGMSA